MLIITSRRNTVGDRKFLAHKNRNNMIYICFIESKTIK